MLRSLLKFYKSSERFFHLLVGVPSYDKYLEHHHKYHPNCKPKTRKEFFLEMQNQRYGSDGAKKCC
ncbi:MULTISPECIES: KCU-star family selenoprotein [unclassified Helicobacter]|uniref:KCU-star family selenoprotein n=1 Tax=unclassified Helicobacter TaxID=2593540 RepID=UPI000CF05935|nr:MULTISPECIES: KCU-star family selenoprotein [unclassified Helicobacter]